MGHKNTLIFDDPRRLELDIAGSVAGGLDRPPEFQNVSVDVDQLADLRARVSYSDVRRSLGAVDEESGRRWSAMVGGEYVDGTTVPPSYATYDQGVLRPLIHSSIWSRSAAGFSPRDQRSNDSRRDDSDSLIT